MAQRPQSQSRSVQVHHRSLPAISCSHHKVLCTQDIHLVGSPGSSSRETWLCVVSENNMQRKKSLVTAHSVKDTDERQKRSCSLASLSVKKNWHNPAFDNLNAC